MSKSYGNAIYLSDSPEVVGQKVDSMLTDPQRTHRHIPGNPDVCPVFATHKVFSSQETVGWADSGCRTADIGCRDCKQALKESLLSRLAPIGERRREYASNPDGVRAILRQGADEARAEADVTMQAVRKAMQIG